MPAYPRSTYPDFISLRLWTKLWIFPNVWSFVGAARYRRRPNHNLKDQKTKHSFPWISCRRVYCYRKFTFATLNRAVGIGEGQRGNSQIIPGKEWKPSFSKGLAFRITYPFKIFKPTYGTAKNFTFATLELRFRQFSSWWRTENRQHYMVFAILGGLTNHF